MARATSDKPEPLFSAFDVPKKPDSRFGNCLALQDLGSTLLPFRHLDKARPECFKCNTKLGKLNFSVRHHCRCCGEVETCYYVLKNILLLKLTLLFCPV